MLELPTTFLITDGRGDRSRIRRLVSAVVGAGVRGVQLREPGLTARELRDLCLDLKPELDAVGGWLLVNDRADLVAAGHAHGVQLGRRSLPLAEVRRFLPPSARIGCSVHDPAEIEAGQGADFLVLSPLFATGCKPGVAGLGLETAGRWIAGSGRPVVVLGGIAPGNVLAARGIGASAVAVMSALCDAVDPEATARRLVASADAPLP